MKFDFQEPFAITLTTLDHPDVKAGLALLQILKAACEDQTIKASPKILSCIKALRDRLSNSSIGASDAEMLAPLMALVAEKSATQTRSVVESEYLNRLRTIAKAPRGNAKNITTQVVADYCNTRPNQRMQTILFELSELYAVSVRTIGRRIQEAKKENLMP